MGGTCPGPVPVLRLTRRLLKLIRRYLEAGLMEGGIMAYPKSWFDRMGLVSLLDTQQRFPAAS